MKKYYRLGFDRTFTKKNKNHLEYDGKNLLEVGFIIIIMVYDKDGNEYLFEEEELSSQRLYFENEDSAYLNSFYKVYIDKEKLIDVRLNKSLMQLSGYDFKYEITGYHYYGNNYRDSFDIEEKEFMNIIKSNINIFDDINNKPTESTSYCAIEVSQEEIPKKMAIKYPSVKVNNEYCLSIVESNEGNLEVVEYLDQGIEDQEKVRAIAEKHLHKLNGDQFILLDTFENGRLVDRGKMYFE